MRTQPGIQRALSTPRRLASSLAMAKAIQRTLQTPNARGTPIPIHMCLRSCDQSLPLTYNPSLSRSLCVIGMLSRHGVVVMYVLRYANYASTLPLCGAQKSALEAII